MMYIASFFILFFFIFIFFLKLPHDGQQVRAQLAGGHRIPQGHVFLTHEDLEATFYLDGYRQPGALVLVHIHGLFPDPQGVRVQGRVRPEERALGHGASRGLEASAGAGRGFSPDLHHFLK